ncbi:MAG: hypothetical protein IPG01_14245 [Chitinophagaceae bacterium]|nr:hypothetical protein [Chitinophagaceae bacterium]
MRFIYSHFFFVFAILFLFKSAFAQYNLGASSYSQNFNTIGGGLPTGWAVYSTGSATSLGTVATFTSTATTWGTTTGQFANYSSGNAPATSTDNATTQSLNSDRVLAVRQTAGFGDPGAAFAFQVANTIGMTNFSLSFNLMQLDPTATTRSTVWRVDYGFGSSPSSFTAVTTSPLTLTTTTGTWATTNVSVNFGTALDNNAGPVWIRILTVTATTGAGNRPVTGVDDFNLSYTGGSTIIYSTQNSGLWSNTATWVGSVIPPNGSKVLVNSSHNVTIDIAVNPESIEIATGGTLTCSNVGSIGVSSFVSSFLIYGDLVIPSSCVTPSTFNVYDLTISNGADFQNSAGIATVVNISYFNINDGGTYTHDATGSTPNGVAADFPGSVARFFSSSSSVIFTKWANGGPPGSLPSSVSWGNLAINITSLGGAWQQSAALSTVQGHLNIQATGGNELRFNANTPIAPVFSIGSLSISGGTVIFSSGTSNPTVNINGDINLTGGILNLSSSLGAATVAVSGDVNINGGTLNLGSSTGASNITLYGNWTRTSGTFIPNNKYVYFGGSGIQTINSTGGETFSYLFVQNNSTVQLLSAVNVINSNGLSLQSSAANNIDLNGQTMTLTGGGNLSLSSGNRTIGSSSGTGIFNVTTSDLTISNGGTLTFGSSVEVQISKGFDCGTGNISTINGSLIINNGGFISNNAPIYATSSLLKYNTTGVYGRNLEWNATTGASYPYHVQISNNTTLNLGAYVQNVARVCGGDLTIDAGSTLTMQDGLNNHMTQPLTVNGSVNLAGTLTLSTQGGGDIKVGKDWSFTVGGTFYSEYACRFFIGTTQQNITRSAAGTLSFDYVINDNSSVGGVQLSTGTDIYISTVSGGNGLQLLDIGPFDLNGQTCTLGNGAWGSIQLTGGARNIISSGGTGIFIINGSPITTPVVFSSDGTSTLTFGSSVRVELNNGFNFGNKLTTIAGTLRMNANSFVSLNAPYYANGSLLQYYTGGNFNRTIEWGATSDDGYPYNVSISNNSTLIPGGSSNTGIALNLENDLTIDNGSSFYMDYGAVDMTVPLKVGNDININGNLSLSEQIGGDIEVGGNWTRNGITGNFYPKDRAVFLNGSGLQTLTVAGGSATETFDYLIIDNNGAGVSLSATDIHVDDLLTLSNGMVTTGSNEVYVPNNAGTAITGYQTDPAGPNLANYLGSSYINGNLRREVIAGNNYVFPVGTATSYQYDSISLTTFSGASNILCFYTAGNISGATQCTDPATQSPAVTVLGTPITNLLLGGYWTMTPERTPTAVDYDITLQESQPFLDLASDDSSYAIIKRDDCTSDWDDEGLHDDATQISYPNVATAQVVRAFQRFSYIFL